VAGDHRKLVNWIEVVPVSQRSWFPACRLRLPLALQVQPKMCFCGRLPVFLVGDRVLLAPKRCRQDLVTILSLLTCCISGLCSMHRGIVLGEHIEFHKVLNLGQALIPSAALGLCRAPSLSTPRVMSAFINSCRAGVLGTLVFGVLSTAPAPRWRIIPYQPGSPDNLVLVSGEHSIGLSGRGSYNHESNKSYERTE